MIKHAVIIKVDETGLSVSVDKWETESDTFQALDFDFNTDKDCAFLMKALSQTLFAYTCLPPSSIDSGQISWKSTSPINDSDHAADECFYPSATK